MKMVNMKLDPAAKEKRAETISVEEPRYPYGLCLHLDDEVVKKLGLDKMPDVGKPVQLTAHAVVQSVSENQYTSEGGKTETRQSISLQITDLGIGKVEATSDAGEKLYAGKG